MQYGIRVGGSEKSAYEKLSDSVHAAVPQPIDACAAFPYVDLSFTVNVREICASRWMVSELRSLIPSARDGREQRVHSPDSRVHPVLQVTLPSLFTYGHLARDFETRSAVE